MKYMLIFASDNSWDTTDSILIEAPTVSSVEHNLHNILESFGNETETVDGTIANHRYYIHAIDEPDYEVKE